jgi:hypothetical protein
MFLFPYAGIIRIRLEGLFSARDIGHPIKFVCKGTIFYLL